MPVVERTGGVSPGVEELGHAASVMLQGFADRLSAREKCPDGDVCEWTHLPFQDGEAYVLDVREGRLARVPAGESWILFLMYRDSNDMRLLTRGKRSHVERYAQEVLRYGPPGAPTYRGNELEWKRSGHDGTLHAATLGGELRLMPLRGGDHLLLFARNDYAVFVLAMGGLDALQRDAEDHLLGHRGDPLRVRFGDDKLDLHGLGAGSVVGYLEVVHDMRLVLGHLGGTTFGLFQTRGTERNCVRLYTLADLRRGDLGCPLGWTVPAAEPTGSAAADPAHPTAPPPNAPGPRQPPTGIGGAFRQQARRAAALGLEDLRLVQRHLEGRGMPTGPGSTVAPKILEGLRVLVELGARDLLLRASALRRLIVDRARVHIHCCSKTLARALVAVSAYTRLLVRDGRRWRLCLGDLLLEESELLAWVKSVTPTYGGDTFTPPPRPEGHAGDFQPPAPEPQEGQDLETEAVRTSADYSDQSTTSPPEAAAPSGYQRRVRTDGQPTFWRPRLPRLPDEESASRWSGRKPRGPPKA